MFAALISDDMYAHDRMWWWDHVYGFDMSPLRPSVLADAQVDVVPSATISTVEREIAHWDLGKCTVDELDFSATVEWELLKAKRHHGLVIWFDTDFDHPTDPESVDAVILSTSPHAMETHWKQTVLLFPESLESIEGGNLKIELKVRKSKGNKRELVIEGHIMVEGAVEEPCKNDWKQVWFVQ